MRLDSPSLSDVHKTDIAISCPGNIQNCLITCSAGTKLFSLSVVQTSISYEDVLIIASYATESMIQN